MIAATIFCVGSWAGVRAVEAFRSAGGAQYFYQSDFGPAVMLACGRVFQDPDVQNAPALAAFLSQRTETVDCAAIPRQLSTTAMNPFQRSVLYLEAAVGLIWKVAGITWSHVDILCGLLFGALAAATYGVLRLAMSRLLALAVLVPSVTSTSNFMQVPQLRDYAKGPFLVAAMLIMGLVVIGPTDRRRAFALSALAGAVIGLGVGFRADVLIALPPFVIALALLAPPTVSFRARTAAIGLFVLTLAVVAFPVLRGLSAGGNNGHVIMLGLTADFDRPLRIQPSVYEFGGRYVDSLASTTINSYAMRVGYTAPVSAASIEYERAAGSYLAELAATFPGDMITRVAAAIRAMPKYFLDSSLYPPVQVQSELLRYLYSLRARAFWRIAHVAFFALAAATVLVSAANRRAAWLIVLVMLCFAGVSAIQFHERHFFYLQFLPWWTFGLFAQAVVDRRQLLAALTRERIVQAAIFTAIVGAIAAGAIGLSRAYQQRAASRLFGRYEAASQSVQHTAEFPAGPGRSLIAAPEWLGRLPAGFPSIGVRFLAVRFRDDLCAPADLPVTIRYDGTRRDADLSETLLVRLRPAASAATTLFVPAYDWKGDYIRFRGIELPASRTRCVSHVARVEGLDRTPLLLTTSLSAGWRRERLYQRLH